MEAPSPSPRPWWPTLRAVLIALHILAITLQAMPSPGGGMSRSSWKQPTVQGEFAAWTTRLQTLGWQGDQAALEERLWDFASEFVAKRKTLLAPFQPYYRYAGTFQSWRMFVAPHRHPAVLHVDVLEGSHWQPVYVARDPAYTWLRRQLNHDRFRAQIFRLSWPSYRRTYGGFVDWLARRAAQDFPEATQLRARFWRYQHPLARPGSSPR